MARSKAKETLPAKSLDALVELFDTQDMGDYWEQMPEAQFDIDIQKRTHLVAIDEELLERLTAIAKAKRVPAETLIHTWLKEKMLEAN
jgi:hypothetical protein